MDIKKVGEFIRSLRIKNKFTQEDLADRMHISRQTISDIENGKIEPSFDKVKDFAEIFKVSIMDIYAGDILKSEETDKVNKTIKFMNESFTKSIKLKYKKIILLLTIIVVLSVTSILCYYFFNTYNSVKFYEVSGKSANFFTNNGLLILSKENIYFSLNINSKDNKKITSLSLKYKNNNEEELIQKVTDNYFYILDYYNYNAYFDYDSIVHGKGSYYVEIEYDNTIEQIDLNILKEYENKKIIFKKRKKMVEESSSFENIEYDIPPKIKDNFDYENNVYNYKEYVGDYTVYLTYLSDITMFTVYEEFENYTKNWNYNISSGDIDYVEKDNNLNILNNKTFSFKAEEKDQDFIHFKIDYVDKYLK